MQGGAVSELSLEVRANLVYRDFTRIGGGKTPDEKTMGRLARQLRPEAIRQIHHRVVAMAKEESLVQGRRMRVDTTVAETSNSMKPKLFSRYTTSARVPSRLSPILRPQEV